MFAYFGYGSNINLISLRAKGVEPLSSQPGILRGWCLKFNVQHWFRHEGGVGNIQPSTNPDHVVEGIIHFCKEEDLAKLDAMESYGVGYDRIEVELESAGGIIKALTYVGLPAILDDRCLPTRRYLNIITRGAEIAGLSRAYIENLRKQPLHEAENYPDFKFPSGDFPQYTAQTLPQYPHLTALAGAVFDMRGARSRMEIIAELFGGKDMTLFLLKRLDTSDGTETLEDIKNGKISAEGKAYLNAYLNEYAREFKYAGRFDFHTP